MRTTMATLLLTATVYLCSCTCDTESPDPTEPPVQDEPNPLPTGCASQGDDVKCDAGADVGTRD
jgi:hypothetical protein